MFDGVWRLLAGVRVVCGVVAEADVLSRIGLFDDRYLNTRVRFHIRGQGRDGEALV